MQRSTTFAAGVVRICIRSETAMMIPEHYTRAHPSSNAFPAPASSRRSKSPSKHESDDLDMRFPAVLHGCFNSSRHFDRTTPAATCKTGSLAAAHVQIGDAPHPTRLNPPDADTCVTRASISTRMRALAALLMLPVLNSRAVEGTSVVGFRDYVTTLPPIKRLVYSRPAEMTSQNGKPLSGTLTYDLGIENEGKTFFLRNLTNFPEHPTNFLGGKVIGLTFSTQYWTLDWRIPGGRVITSTKIIPLKEVISPADSDGPYAENEITFVRSLGLGFLIPGTLQWSGDKRFSGRTHSPTWPKDVNEYTLDGEITRLDKTGRPLEIRMESTSLPPGQRDVRVKYEYDDRSPEWFPSTVTLAVTVARVGVIEQPYRIHTVEFGEAHPGPNGYTPSLFLGNEGVALKPLLLVRSNDMQYLVDESGMHQVWKSPPKNRWYINTVLLLVVSLAFTGFLAWMLRSRLRARTQKLKLHPLHTK